MDLHVCRFIHYRAKAGALVNIYFWTYVIGSSRTSPSCMEVLILDTNLGQDFLVEVMNLYIYYLPGILVCGLDSGGHH